MKTRKGCIIILPKRPPSGVPNEDEFIRQIAEYKEVDSKVMMETVKYIQEHW